MPKYIVTEVNMKEYLQPQAALFRFAEGTVLGESTGVTDLDNPGSYGDWEEGSFGENL